MFLLKEPEKVTYRYINTETKKTDVITFQNFQKLFLENDMTWKYHKDKFIYTVRRLPAPNTNQSEQIITKNFNENTYLDRLNRENIFWVTYNNGRAYSSVNWIYHYLNTPAKDFVYLEDKRASYFEQIRKTGFDKETNSERKLDFATSEYFRSMHPELKKYVTLVFNGTRVQLRPLQGMRFFVLKSACYNRFINFLQGSTFAAERDMRLITHLDFDEKSLYEFKLKSEMQYIRTLDFSLPSFR